MAPLDTESPVANQGFEEGDSSGCVGDGSPQRGLWGGAPVEGLGPGDEVPRSETEAFSLNYRPTLILDFLNMMYPFEVLIGK